MFRPIRDVVIVKKIEGDKQTKSGLFIPATETKDFHKGEVVAAGDGILTDNGVIVPLGVKVGDVIVFGKSGSVDIVIDGENFVMMRESNILGVV